MMNDAGSHSERFEELCALAASGQITESEFVELSDHMRNCVPCQTVYGDFIDLVHNKLPLADPELTSLFRPGRPSLKESSYRERFVARARKEGLAVSREALRSIPESRSVSSWFLRLSFAQFAPLALALLVMTAGVLGYAWRQSSARNAILEAKLAAADGQIRPLERPEPGPTQSPSPESLPQSRSLPLNAVREPAVAPPNSNEPELARLRQDYATALEKANAAEKRMQEISSELQIVKGESAERSDAMARLQNSLNLAEAARDRAIGDLRIARNDLGEIRSTNANLSRENKELKDLNVKLNTPTQLVRRSNVLFAPGREIGDQLLDLRSVDVHDVDSKGRESKASARVFYTDGKSKSLLLIATGLSKRDGANGGVFQVWGARGMNGTNPRSLGHFELDNKETDLWALAVNDPAKLAGVDTVFVTLEKGGESEKPTTDKRIMDAYLPQIPVKR
jgi:hypothetical protein